MSSSFIDMNMTVTSGTCTPTALCEYSNCDQLKDMMPSSIVGMTIEIQNCQTACCTDDLCNGDEIEDETSEELECYNIQKSVSNTGVGNIDSRSTMMCPSGSSCQLVKAQTKIQGEFFSMTTNVTVGSCVPSSGCDSNSCDALQGVLPESLGGVDLEIVNCETSCCDDNLCNDDSDYKAEVSTTMPTSSETTSYITGGTKSVGLQCYTTLISESFGIKATDQQTVTECREGSVCMLLLVETSVTYTYLDGVTDPVTITQGTCFPASLRDSSNCESLANSDFLAKKNDQIVVVESCRLSFCDDNLCNDHNGPLLPTHIPTVDVTDSGKPLECYAISQTESSLAAANTNSRAQKTCSPGSSCSRVVADIKMRSGFIDMNMTVTSGSCTPTALCEYSNCDQLKDMMPSSLVGMTIEIQNCQTACCTDDLCNGDEIKDETQSKELECYKIQKLVSTTGVGNIDSRSTMMCPSGSSCQLVKAQTQIDGEFFSMTTNVTVGSCVPSSSCDSNSCDALQGILPESVGGVDLEIMHCETSCCEYNLCNDDSDYKAEVSTTMPTSSETTPYITGVRECYIKSTDYRGVASITETGRNCQAWDSQYPHEHVRTVRNYPSSGLEHNYCRDPDEEGRPWCYTTDQNKRWEFCDVSICEGYATTKPVEITMQVQTIKSTPHKAEECHDAYDNGAGYRGFANTTERGGICQEWNSQTSHEHSITPEKYPKTGLVENYCRNPDKSDRPWCYTVDNEALWEYCLVPFCGVKECYIKSTDYRGVVSRTETGRNCQKWDSQFPHDHVRTVRNYPSSGLEHNYCRDPDKEGRPWCYTTDEKKRWEFCNVSICEGYATTKPVEVTMQVQTTNSTPRGLECYNIQKSETDSGIGNSNSRSTIMCPPESSCQLVIAHTLMKTDFFNMRTNVTVGNCVPSSSCKSKSCDVLQEILPDSVGEIDIEIVDCDTFCCNDNLCNDDKAHTFTMVTGTPALEKSTEAIFEDVNGECYNAKDNGASYRDEVATTESGIVCQEWASQTPHEHTRTPLLYPDSGLVNNFCRNPDGSDRPWCYTTSSMKRWEHCAIPVCGGVRKSALSLGRNTNAQFQGIAQQGPITISRPTNAPTTTKAKVTTTAEPTYGCYTIKDFGASYRGLVAETETGRTCQQWDSQKPQGHTRTPFKYPNSGLTENYCRNPDNEARPWCYTTDPGKRWEFCDIQSCKKPVALEPTFACYTASDKGASYRGLVATTKSGFTCQEWSSQSPHGHSRTAENYPKGGLIRNLCRNPDAEDKPWCYTTDPVKRWEFCDIPDCSDYDATQRLVNTPPPITTAPTGSTDQEAIDPKDCYSVNDLGAGYRGKVSKTKSGRSCQAWTSQTPHGHSRTPINKPDSGLVSNYCRNPDNEIRPWCYTTDQDQRWEYCDIPVCLEKPSINCYTAPGVSYRGKVAVTESGKTCQPWTSQTPHRHMKKPEYYPGFGLVDNYCRNPDADKKPWCYTNDENTRWEYCDIPVCDDPCYTPDDLGASYRGFVAQTEYGRDCQLWSTQKPHRHDRTPQIYPDSGLVNNYCRNPDAEDRPWCYTVVVSERWEYCDIPACTEAENALKVMPEEIPGVVIIPETTDCYHMDDSGAKYRGKVAVTESGRTCQRWSSQSPQGHDRTSTNYPKSGLVDNFCRNPDNEFRPWCYTTDSEKRWEFCDVSTCQEVQEPTPPNGDVCYDATNHGASYRGYVSRTESGKKCQEWAAQTPHGHNRNQLNYPTGGLEKNYCRNPDNEFRPWCYTTDREKRWEYCDVPACPGTTVDEVPQPEPTLKCYTSKNKGSNYRGKVAVTENGKACQKWASQTPHGHTRTPENNPTSGLVDNYCRNPDGEDRPWCYTMDSTSRWEFCDIPECSGAEPVTTKQPVTTTAEPVAECYTPNDLGMSYRGLVTRTKSGKACQDWDSQTPHAHSRTPENMPRSGLVDNYCRNPDKEARPWCYTVDKELRWEFCDIPACEENPMITCFTAPGISYRGNMSITESGRTCQSWSSQTPHEHTRSPINFPNFDMENNYCRNPDADVRPWCYTTDPDKRWEYCDIQECEKPVEGPTNCYAESDMGASYRGTVSVTNDGTKCQDWNSQKPHRHDRTPDYYSHSGLENNYCRNPDSELGPWCYTSNIDQRWAYCNVSKCSEKPPTTCYNALKISSNDRYFSYQSTEKICGVDEKCILVSGEATNDNLDSTTIKVTYADCAPKDDCSNIACTKSLLSVLPAGFEGSSVTNCKVECCKTSNCNSDEEEHVVAMQPTVLNPTLDPLTRIQMMQYDIGFFPRCSLRDYISRANIPTTVAVTKYISGVQCDSIGTGLDMNTKSLDTQCFGEATPAGPEKTEQKSLIKYMSYTLQMHWIGNYVCDRQSWKDLKKLFQPMISMCGDRASDRLNQFEIEAWILIHKLQYKDSVGYCKAKQTYQSTLTNFILSDDCQLGGTEQQQLSRKMSIKILVDAIRSPLVEYCSGVDMSQIKSITPPEMTYYGSEQDGVCTQTNVDLMILVDSTRSRSFMKSSYYSKVSKMLLKVVDKLKTSPTTRLSIAQFSKTIRVVYPFTPTMTANDYLFLEGAVVGMAPMVDRRRLYHSIEAATMRFKTSSRYADKCTKKMMMLITSGPPSDKKTVKNAVLALSNENVPLYILGIPENKVSATDLQELSRQLDYVTEYYTKDFELAEDHVLGVVSQLVM